MFINVGPVRGRSALRPIYFHCIIYALLTLFILTGADDELKKDKDWDVLIFTQHWPATVCFQWKDKNPAHSCTLPSQKNAWTVHGVWPTKLNTMGPNFCDPSKKFVVAGIAAIESQMELYWTNVEKDTPLYSLWDHEWSKHGTCAAALPTLNDEMKYFAQGLKWLQQYSMTNVLAKSNILPNDTAVYNSEDVYQAVKNGIGKNPSLHCSVDPHTGLSYLFEIRICFDKSLELIDCDGVKTESGSVFNKSKLNHCDDTKPLIYPSIVPPIKNSIVWELPLIEIYKTITWLRWYTF